VKRSIPLPASWIAGAGAGIGAVLNHLKKLGEMDSEVDRLKKELVERPTKEQLDEMHAGREAARRDLGAANAELDRLTELLRKSRRVRMKGKAPKRRKLGENYPTSVLNPGAK
jgi:hypothetical protein